MPPILVVLAWIAAWVWVPALRPGTCGTARADWAARTAAAGAVAATEAPHVVVGLSAAGGGRLLHAHLDAVEPQLQQALTNLRLAGVEAPLNLQTDLGAHPWTARQEGDATRLAIPLVATLTLTATGVPLLGDLEITVDLQATLDVGLRIEQRDGATRLMTRVDRDSLRTLRLTPHGVPPLLRAALDSLQATIEATLRTLLPTLVADVPVLTLAPATGPFDGLELRPLALRADPDESHVWLHLHSNLPVAAAPPTDALHLPADRHDITLWVAPDALRLLAQQRLAQPQEQGGTPGTTATPVAWWIDQISVATDIVVDGRAHRGTLPCGTASYRAHLQPTDGRPWVSPTIELSAWPWGPVPQDWILGRPGARDRAWTDAVQSATEQTLQALLPVHSSLQPVPEALLVRGGWAGTGVVVQPRPQPGG